jgi:type II secretory pathway component PulK
MRRRHTLSTRVAPETRRGVVLVSVLALLTLGAALIAGAFAAARASARATRSTRAAIVAHAAARRALVRTVTSWRGSDDSMNIGAFDVRTSRESASVALDSADTRLRVHRLSSTLFLVTAEASVPASSAPLARRRVHVVLERVPTIDSTVVSRVRPIARWASGDLY